MTSTKSKARFAGLMYMLLVVSAPASLLYLPSHFFVMGNATATALNITAEVVTKGDQSMAMRGFPNGETEGFYHYSSRGQNESCKRRQFAGDSPLPRPAIAAPVQRLPGGGEGLGVRGPSALQGRTTNHPQHAHCPVE